MLLKCPDEPTYENSKIFSFIADVTARANIAADMESVNSALRNVEWKAATVLAGALCEALLLWRLAQLEDYQSVDKKETLEKKGLADYVELAESNSVISDNTKKQLDLA